MLTAFVSSMNQNGPNEGEKCLMTLALTATSIYLLGEGNGLLSISHTLIFIKNEVPPWCTGLADEKCGGICHCKGMDFLWIVQTI